MKLARAIFSLVLISTLTGCTTLTDFAQNGSYGVAAAELGSGKDAHGVVNPTLDNALAAKNDKEPIWRLVAESQRNCNAFLNGLILAEASTNTTLDMTTTALSALATAFTPITTIHALTAGATVSSGWKTAIDSDVFAKATLDNFAHAIQSTYYTSMQKYVANLQAEDVSKVDGGAEVAAIQSIHAQCSLGAAENSISAALTPSKQTAAPAATTSDTVVVLSGSITPTNTLVLVGTWSGGSASPTYTVVAGDTLATITTGLISKVNNAVGAAGISAIPNGTNAFVLQSPASLNVSWKDQSPAGQSTKMQLIPPVKPPAPAAAAAPAVVVPGQSPNAN